MPGVAHQILEQAKFEWTELDDQVASRHPAIDTIHLEIGDAQNRLPSCERWTARDRVKSCEEFRVLERLGQVVVTPSVEALNFVVETSQRRQEEHGRSDCPLTQFSHDSQAIEIR